MGQRKNAALDIFVMASTLPKRLLSPSGLQYDNTHKVRSMVGDTQFV